MRCGEWDFVCQLRSDIVQELALWQLAGNQSRCVVVFKSRALLQRQLIPDAEQLLQEQAGPHAL
eukprot:scaffold1067_cov278-Pinguiococcus_pyrenoidosus.AAC.1